jgi:hypothetical protein
MFHSWLKGDGIFWKSPRSRRRYVLAVCGVLRRFSLVGCEDEDDEARLRGLEISLSAVTRKHSLGSLQSVKQLDVPSIIFCIRSRSSWRASPTESSPVCCPGASSSVVDVCSSSFEEFC